MVAWRAGADLDHHSSCGIIEAKVVANRVFEQRWQDGPPLAVELQHQAQFACTGAGWGVIAALVVGTFRFELLLWETVPEPQAIALIERTAHEFLARLAADQLPEPDDHASSLAALATIYPSIDPGKIVTLSGDDLGEGLRRFDAWEQASLDRLAAEKIEEASKKLVLPPRAGRR